jgi:hypothetical protein
LRGVEQTKFFQRSEDFPSHPPSTAAVYTNTPIMTTLSGAKATALVAAVLKKSGYAVKTLQEYH